MAQKKCLKKNRAEAANLLVIAESLWPQSKEEVGELSSMKGEVLENVRLYLSKIHVFPSSVQHHTYIVRHGYEQRNHPHINPKDVSPYHRHTCSTMFTASLFTIGRH